MDLALEKKNGDFVRGLIETGTVKTCHDLSDGGLFVALAEMVIASGRGMKVHVENGDVLSMPMALGKTRHAMSCP